MQKQFKLYAAIAAIAAIGTILYFLFFRHDPTDGHVHADGTGHAAEESAEAGHGEEHAHEGKTVHLNEAQFRNAGIDTGWFESKNLSEVILANGYTKLPPQNQAQVGVQLPGTIQSILVMEGEYVRAGQVLATMQSLAYNNLRLEREKLDEQLQVSLANLTYLQQEFDRQQALHDENVNAGKVVQKTSADLRMEEAKVKALKNQIEILGQNIGLVGRSASPTVPITAPISGSITEVNVTIGAAAEVGRPLFSIVDNTKMHVDLLVYEKDLFKVRPGQSVRFILTNQGNQEIQGKIFSVGKAFENDTKSVAVHAVIVNEKQILIPGMYVNALIDIGAQQMQALPLDAVVKAEGRSFIFVWDQENQMPQPKGEAPETTFSRVEVKTGTTQLGFVQVTPLSEIHPGDKIVLKGTYYLQSHLQKSEGGGGHQH